MRWRSAPSPPVASAASKLARTSRSSVTATPAIRRSPIRRSRLSITPCSRTAGTSARVCCGCCAATRSLPTFTTSNRWGWCRASPTAPAPSDVGMASEPIYGAVEAGGTKFICAVGRSVHDMLEEKRIATRQPAETLAEVLQFFHAMQIKYGRMRGFGIASFGPIQLDRRAQDWGRMLATPKPGWANANLITALQPVADWGIGLNTHVNEAA